jgi:hypothetical protein
MASSEELIAADRVEFERGDTIADHLAAGGVLASAL